MVVPKQGAMILHIFSENDCGSFIATSGGELLKFVKKEKVKDVKIACSFKKSSSNNI